MGALHLGTDSCAGRKMMSGGFPFGCENNRGNSLVGIVLARALGLAGEARCRGASPEEGSG